MDSLVSSPAADPQAQLSAWMAANRVDLFDDGSGPYAVHGSGSCDRQQPQGGPLTHVAMNALALLKILMHASAGGDIEVMGLMLGRVAHSTFYVFDAFALPVEGTETRVNAAEDANEYMVEYTHAAAQLTRCCDAVVGWYHSHPGYGCWLSGIDVATQRLQQTYQDPFVAIVVDPHSSHAPTSLKVDVGAFRTLPPSSPSAVASASAAKPRSSVSNPVPTAKAGDFDANLDQYVSLDISYFMSRSDSNLLATLWDQYWIDTVAKAPLLVRERPCCR